MKKYIILLISLFVLFSCNNEKELDKLNEWDKLNGIILNKVDISFKTENNEKKLINLVAKNWNFIKNNNIKEVKIIKWFDTLLEIKFNEDWSDLFYDLTLNNLWKELFLFVWDKNVMKAKINEWMRGWVIIKIDSFYNTNGFIENDNYTNLMNEMNFAIGRKDLLIKIESPTFDERTDEFF